MDDPGSDTFPRAKSTWPVDQGRAQSGRGISLTWMILSFIYLFIFKSSICYTERIGRPWQIHCTYLDKRKWKDRREKEGKRK